MTCTGMPDSSFQTGRVAHGKKTVDVRDGVIHVDSAMPQGVRFTPRTDIRRQRLKNGAQRLAEQIARLPKLVRIAKGIDEGEA
jgi:hypothetical protein